MSGRRGFTLIELTVVSALAMTAAGIMGGVVYQMQRERTMAEAYAGDLRGLQRAVQALEADLTAAHLLDGTVIGDVTWSLDGQRLLRGDRVMAECVSEFAIQREGDLATVRLAIAPRDPRAARPPARIQTTIRLRGLEARR